MRHVNASQRQSLASSLESSRSETVKYQEQLTSGLRVTKPSDDPAVYPSAARLRSGLRELESDQRKVDAGQSLLRHHDQALSELTMSARQMKNLVLRAANEGATQQLYDSIAEEVNVMMEQGLSAANTQVGKSYLLSGSKKLTKPFVAQRNGDEITSVAYQGDSAAAPLSLPGGGSLPLSLNGRDVTQGGGSDFFATAIELRDSLRDGKIDADSFLEKFASIEENFVSRRAEAGSVGSYLEEIGTRLDQRKLSLESSLDGLVGADPATTAAHYFASENQTQATLALIGRQDRMSLIDYLR